MNDLSSKEKVCEDQLQLIYEHGHPSGIRDRHGYLLHFNRVPRFPDQEERYQRELAQRIRLANFLLAALRSSDEPPVRRCNHSAISPKGTMFYHGFVSNQFNQWRCDVCRGIYEGNLTEPMNPGSQALTLVSSSQPQSPSFEHEAGGSRERGTSPNRSCGTAGQSGPASSPPSAFAGAPMRVLEWPELSGPKPQRYDLRNTSLGYDPDYEMVRDDDGEWVRWDDIEPHLKTSEPPSDALVAMEHVLNVFKSMADRGHYPIELLPYVEGEPNPTYLGKQGWQFLTDAIAACRAPSTKPTCQCGHPFAPNHQTPGTECSVEDCQCGRYRAAGETSGGQS